MLTMNPDYVMICPETTIDLVLLRIARRPIAHGSRSIRTPATQQFDIQPNRWQRFSLPSVLCIGPADAVTASHTTYLRTEKMARRALEPSESDSRSLGLVANGLSFVTSAKLNYSYKKTPREWPKADAARAMLRRRPGCDTPAADVASRPSIQMESPCFR